MVSNSRIVSSISANTDYILVGRLTPNGTSLLWVRNSNKSPALAGQAVPTGNVIKLRS